ncbi:MAG: hypothetical protein ACKOD2_01005, partial [Ilumatobacteraceae bacterium]
PDVNRLLIRTITDRVVELGGDSEQREVIEQTVTKQMESPTTQRALRSAVVGAYDVLTTGDTDVVDIALADQGGELRRDLVAIDPRLDESLPAADELVRFTLFERGELPWSYRAVESAHSASWALFIAGCAMVLAALVLGPGRLSLFAISSLVASLGMLIVWLLVTTGVDRVIGAIDDALSRRVARLTADRILGAVESLSLAIAIFAGVAFVGGALATVIRNKYYPPKPKVVRAPVPPMRPPGMP